MDAQAGIRSIDSARRKHFVREPASGKLIGEVFESTPEEVRRAVASARLAQVEWGKRSFKQRAQVLHAIVDQMMEHKDELSKIISRENGKPEFEALLHEIINLGVLTRYYARKAGRILRDENVRLALFPHKRSYIRHVPRGVVAVISPWNFPLLIAFGDVMMALAAGNAVVHKPSELTPLIADRMRELMIAAGVPADLYQIVHGPGPIGQALIEAAPDMVAFTGSVAVGKKIGALCGERLIPYIAELGGKNPAVVMPGADLDRTARSLMWGAFANSGQMCAAASRLIVHESVSGPFVQRIVEQVKALRQGDPQLQEVDIGAMTRPGQIEFIEKKIEEARSAGAKIEIGGRRRAGVEGRFFEPTVITNVTPEMGVWREELFGPVLAMTTYRTEDEAVRLANDTVYGLQGYVFGPRQRAELVAHRVQAGSVVVNDVLYNHGCPEVPWGGVKQSGIGRVHGDAALRDFCEVRHIATERIGLTIPQLLFPYLQGKHALVKRAGGMLLARGFLNKLRALIAG